MKKWRTIVALIPLILAIVMQWWWFFTLLFIFQIVFSVLSGSIEYVEEVKRSEHPILFWIIIGIWASLAFYSAASFFL